MSLKNTSLNEVLKAILTVADGKTYFDSNIIVKGSHQEKSKKGLLTRRQKEILALVAQGKSSREIAEELYIGIHTVDTHRKNMIRILGIKGKGEFLRYAIEKKYKFWFFSWMQLRSNECKNLLLVLNFMGKATLRYF